MSEDFTESPRNGPRGSAQQIARIAALLGELEALSAAAAEVPGPLLTETRAGIEKALGVLKNCEQGAWRTGEDEEGDPQPDIDNDLLERMYRSIGTGRRPPER